MHDGRCGTVLRVLFFGMFLAFAGGCGDGTKTEATGEAEEPDLVEKYSATNYWVEPEVDSFFGPTPFTVKVWTTVKNAKGDLSWEWNLGDGTKSTEKEVSHTFTKPGLYSIGVAVTDSATGERDGGTLLVRAMTEEEWAGYLAKMEAVRKAREGAGEKD